MKKLLFIFLILQACTTTQNIQVVDYSSNPKLLFFLKHSDDSNQENKAKLNNWIKDLQRRYSLNIVGKSFDVSSSLSFDEQIQNCIKETKPKYVFSYNYSPPILYSTKNKYVFVLKDSTGKMIQDKVYHDWLWIGLSDIAKDFEKLETLK